MATVVLAAVGGTIGASIGASIGLAGTALAIAGGIGQAIGASIGYQIDAQIFGLNDVPTGQGQRIEEFSLSSGQPGTPMFEAWGREARVPGHFIFVGEIEETSRTRKVADGGKGGDDAYLTEYLYDVDVAVGILNAKHRQMRTAHTIIMNGKKVADFPLDTGTDLDRGRGDRQYDDTDDDNDGYLRITGEPRVSDGKVRDVDFIFTGERPSAGSGKPYPGWNSEDKIYTSDGRLSPNHLDIDRTQAKKMRKFVNKENGTFEIKLRYTLPNEMDVNDLFQNNTANTPYQAEASFKGWQRFVLPGTADPGKFLNYTGLPFDFKQIGDGTTIVNNLAVRLTEYDGTQSTPDPSIDAFEKETDPDNSAPCFKGTAYYFFESLSLEEFGNGLPRTEFVVDMEGSYLTDAAGTQLGYGITVDTVISQILQNAGFAASEIDVSGIDATRAKNGVYGFGVEGSTSAGGKIAALMNWHDIRLREQDGKLVFFDADNPSTGTVAASELRPKEEQSDSDDELILIDAAEFSKVTDVDLQSRNVNDDGLALAVRANNPIATHVNEKSLNFRNISSPQGMAKNVAHRVLFQQERSSRRVQFKLPPNRIDVVENDRLTVTSTSGEVYPVRVNRIARGANFLHEIEGTIEDSDFIYSDTTVGGDGDGGQDVETEGDSNFSVFVAKNIPKGFLDINGVTNPPIDILQSRGVPYAYFMWGPEDFESPNSFINGDYEFFTKISTDSSYEYADEQAQGNQSSTPCGALVRSSYDTNLSSVSNPFVIDDTGSIEIYLSKTVNIDTRLVFEPTLQTITEAELRTLGLPDSSDPFGDAISNIMMLGEELIGFTTVEELPKDDDGVFEGLKHYRLTGLLRNIGSNDTSRMTHQGSELGALVTAKGLSKLFFERFKLGRKYPIGQIDEYLNKIVDVNITKEDFPESGEEAETDYSETGLNMLPEMPVLETFESQRLQGSLTTAGTATTGGTRLPYPASLVANDLVVEFSKDFTGSLPTYNKFPQSGSKNMDHLVDIMNGSNVVRQIYVRGGSDDAVTPYDSRPEADGEFVQEWPVTTGSKTFLPGQLDQQGSSTYPTNNYKFLYTAAQQNTDFGSVQSNVTIRVRARGGFNDFGVKFGEYGGFGPYLETIV